MLGKIGRYSYQIVIEQKPWSNVYGLARSMMALSLLVTLLVNDIQIMFKPIAGVPEYPGCVSIANFSLFCMVPNGYNYLNLIKWLCIIILFLVVIGWRPRFTGIFHWWVAYSMQTTAVSLDGGEQVQAVFALLLIPITLTDRRKWHWEPYPRVDISKIKDLYAVIIATVTFLIIRFQVAIIYLNAPVAKVKQEEWLNGTALYYFFTDPMLGLPPFLGSMFNPILKSPWVVVPTWGTLIVQLLLFSAVFISKKYWKYFLLLGVLLHSMIAIFLGLYSFSLVMCAILILYLRPKEETFKFEFLRSYKKSNLNSDI